MVPLQGGKSKTRTPVVLHSYPTGTPAEVPYSAVVQQYSAVVQQYSAVVQQYSAVVQQYSAVVQQYSTVVQQYSTVLQRYSGSTPAVLHLYFGVRESCFSTLSPLVIEKKFWSPFY